MNNKFLPALYRIHSFRWFGCKVYDITMTWVTVFVSAIKNVKQKVENFQQLLEKLPVPNRFLLSWMIIHMTHIIAKVMFTMSHVNTVMTRPFIAWIIMVHWPCRVNTVNSTISPFFGDGMIYSSKTTAFLNRPGLAQCEVFVSNRSSTHIL